MTIIKHQDSHNLDVEEEKLRGRFSILKLHEHHAEEESKVHRFSLRKPHTRDHSTYRNSGSKILQHDVLINPGKIAAFFNYKGDEHNTSHLNIKQQGSLIFPPGPDAEGDKYSRHIFQKTGSDSFFKRPSKVLEEKKDDDDDDEDTESWFWFIAHIIFPDKAPVIWLSFLFLDSIVAGFMSLISNKSAPNSMKIGICIFFIDFASYLCFMILRLIVFKRILPWLCPEGRIFAALSGTADPELLYSIWAGEIALLWYIQLPYDSHSNTYKVYMFLGDHEITALAGSFLIRGRLIVLVFAIRRLILSFIMFFFMLDFISSISKLLIGFLMKYRFLRQINCTWSKLQPHIVGGLRIQPNSSDPISLSGYSRTSSYLKSKPLNRGDSITLPYFLTETGIEQIKKKKYQNWLAVQFVRQYYALFFVENQYVELKNKKDARLYAKKLFNDMAEHSNEILIFMGKWKAKKMEKIIEPKMCGEEIEHKDLSKFIEVPSFTESYDNISQLSSLSDNSQIIPEKSSFADVSSEKVNTTKFSQDLQRFNTSYPVPEPPIADRRDVQEPFDEYKIPIMFPTELAPDGAREFLAKGKIRPPILASKSLDVIGMTTQRFPNRINENFPTNVHKYPSNIKTQNIDIFHDNEKEPLELNYDVLKVLYGDSIDNILKRIDPSGRKSYNEDDWVRLVVSMYETRKKMINTLESQEGIARVFQRMVSIVLFFFSFIFILIILGVNVNTLVISGAAIISSLSVAMNRLYSNFISSVIFVVFENPYNQGDRIRINGSQVMTVRKIGTFCTTFSNKQSTPVMYPHSWLTDQNIANESRSVQSSDFITFYISDSTSPFVFDAFITMIKQYADDRPLQFTKNSIWIYICSLQPGHYIETRISFCNLNPAYEWDKLLEIRTPFYLFILHTMRQLGIEYFLPESRVIYSSSEERFKRRNQDIDFSRTIRSHKV
ncbi:mechanosensitive ion channel family protein [Cryptosporidium serpentis]